MPSLNANLNEVFVENMQQFMELRGISQAKIAVELDVSTATVSDWCTGKKFPRTARLAQLAQLLQVEVTDLISTDGVRNTANQDMINIINANPDIKNIVRLAIEMDSYDRSLLIPLMRRLVYKDT